MPLTVSTTVLLAASTVTALIADPPPATAKAVVAGTMLASSPEPASLNTSVTVPSVALKVAANPELTSTGAVVSSV